MSILEAANPFENKPHDECSYSTSILQAPVSQNGEINVAMELQAVWSRMEVDREQREMGHKLLEVLLNELHTQKNLFHAQTMVNSAMAKAFDKQMLELQVNVRKELTRCYEHCDRLQNETKSCLKQRDEHPRDPLNKVDQVEITNKTDDVNFVGLKELCSMMENVKDSTASITVEMTKASDQMKVQSEQCKEQCTQGLRNLKNDVDQLRIEASKCKEQCTNNELFCIQAQNLVDQCEQRVTRLDNLRPQWTLSGVHESNVKGKASPARTIKTPLSEVSTQSNSGESWSTYEDEHWLRDDDTSEHEIEGQKRRIAVKQLAAFLFTEQSV